jgi:hypothetical protein
VSQEGFTHAELKTSCILYLRATMINERRTPA